MALTEVVKMRLEANGFVALFDDHAAAWTKMAEDARALMAGKITKPTVDDIKKALFPLIEIEPILRKFLAKSKLTQKYWVSDFTDYILHRIYRPALQTPAEG